MTIRGPIGSRVVVAIPTRNEAGAIEAVLRGLAAADQDLPDLRIVVVDGGSSDGTQGIVARLAAELPLLELIAFPGGNISASINRVARARAGRADILLRCDAHAVYPERYLPRLVESLRRSGATSVVVAMDLLGTGCFQKAVAWVSDTWIGSGGAAHRGGRTSGPVDHGHHAAFRLNAFLAAGGYDESFSHNEDAELDCRLRALGGTIYLDAAVRMQYRPRANAAALWRQYFHYGRGRSRTMRRHPGSARLRQLAAPAHLCLFAASLAAAGLRANWLFLAWPMAYFALLAATSLVFAARRRSLCGFLTGPAAMVMHTAWGLGLICGSLFSRQAIWTPTAHRLVGNSNN